MWFLMIILLFIVGDMGSEITKLRKINEEILKELKNRE